MNVPKALVLGFMASGIASAAAAQPAATEIGPGWHPRMKADTAGGLHLVYHDAQVLYYRAFSGGIWSQREKIPGSDGASGSKNLRHRMHVRPDGSKVYVSWGTGAGADVQFAFRDAGGWHGPEVACPKSVKAWEYAGVTALSGGDAFVFCMFDDVWVARRGSAGAWDAPVQIVPLQTLKHVVADTDASDTIHAVLRGEKVHYFRGDGGTWSSLFELAPPPTTEAPTFVLDPLGQPHVVWQQWKKTGGTYYPAEVRYATGRDDQWTNGNDGVLVQAHTDPANPPEIAMDHAGRIAVGWVEGTAAGSWVFLSLSPDGGSSFLPAEKIAADAAVPKDGNLAHDLATPPAAFVGDELHIVYEKTVKKLVHVTGMRPFPAVDGGTDDSGASDDASAVPDAAGQSDVGADAGPDAGDDGGASADAPASEDGGVGDTGIADDDGSIPGDASQTDAWRTEDEGNGAGGDHAPAEAPPEETPAGCSCALVSGR